MSIPKMPAGWRRSQPSAPRPPCEARDLFQFADPSQADPRDLVIAKVLGRFLGLLGRLSSTNDFIERSLAASRGLWFWPAPVVAAIQGAMYNVRELPGESDDDDLEEDLDDETDSKLPSRQAPRLASFWRHAIDPLRLDRLPPQVFKTLNDDVALRRALAEATLAWAGPDRPWLPEFANAAYMAEAFGLGEEGRKLIELVILGQLSGEFEEALTQLDFGKRHEAHRILALYLGCDQREVARLVAHEGVLSRIGLIDPHCAGGCLGQLLTAEDTLLAANLTRVHESAQAFLSSFLLASAPPKLDSADTAHLQAIKELAVPYLRAAANEAIPGANLLFHGAPGTGKTELVRLVAASAGLQLFEVRFADANGRSLSCFERLGSLLLALQALRGRRDAAILLDEAEEIFTSLGREDWGPAAQEQRLSKAWVTRLIEENQVPILWTANRVRYVDPAVLRRFAVVYEFSELPQSAKRRLAERFLGELEVDPTRIEQVSRLRGLVPSQLEAAATTARLARPGSAEQAWSFARLQLNESRRAMGLPELMDGRAAAIPYDPRCLNLAGGLDAETLLAGLRRNGRAALCFHGLPGTGKTELAAHLARELDRELVVRSGSDLLSKFLGETEERIARMFARCAERAGQVVLLLDEADTFLKDRSKARFNWELSQTNEFLARMEGFPGIFICTTNLADQLDPAVLRRFQFRVEFRGMSLDQSRRLFASSFAREPRPDEDQLLRRLAGQLAPADFANVVRQLGFLGNSPDEGIAERLAEECRCRGVAAQVTRSIGFVH